MQPSLNFYCFAQPVAQGANAYLAAQGSALRAADITGVTGQGLLQYLRGGDPVIVWITKDLSAPRTGGCTWLLADTGETYVPYVNLHCVVLAGWDGDTSYLLHLCYNFLSFVLKQKKETKKQKKKI